MGALRSIAALLLPDMLASFRDRWVQAGSLEVPVVRYQESLIRRIVRYIALGAFAFYLAWNGWWVAKGKLPPSILRTIVGLPCPTTGGYRSFLALCRGEFAQSFLFNPLMLVYLFLSIYSVGVLLRQLVCRKRLVLSPFLAWTWGASLVVGWVAKFALGRQYW
jgi:hypothetical protein